LSELGFQCQQCKVGKRFYYILFKDKLRVEQHNVSTLQIFILNVYP